MKLCLLGCGNHARSVYLPSLQRYKKENADVNFAACCDMDEAKARSYKEDAGFSRHYVNSAEMMETERPDAVILVTPFVHTAAIAIDLAKYGAAIMVEKPIGATLDECTAIAEAAEAHGIPSTAAFNRRSMPLIRALMAELARGGKPIQHIDYKLYRTNRREAHFYSTAVHGIDLVHFIAGADYKHVGFDYRPIDGNGAINIRLSCDFQTGSTANLAFYPAAGLVIERVEVLCEKESYFVNLPVWGGPDSPGCLVKYANGELVYNKSGLEISDGTTMPEDNGFYREIKTFIDSIKNGVRPADDFRSAIDSMRIMDCVRRKDACYTAQE